MFARGIGEKLLDRPVPGRFADGELVGVLEAHEAEVFGQQHELRAVARGFGDQPACLGEIALAIRRADHLQRRDPERRGGGFA